MERCRCGWGWAMRRGCGKQVRRGDGDGAWQDGPFRSADDLALRVPCLNRKELDAAGADRGDESVDGIGHRRDALWQVERAGKLEGPLLRQRERWLRGRVGGVAAANR